MRKNRPHSIVSLRFIALKGLWIILLFLQASFTHAQKKEWDSLAQKFTNFQHHTLQEKIFAHLDRSLYVAGETIWFKLYYVDGYVHRPLDMSKVAYVEILDRDNKAIIQTKISLTDGTGNGQLLLPLAISSGNYLVRVYTNWMKNFSPDFYFHQQITILNTVRRTEPLPKNNSTQYDIQFFPEGGHLVDGIRSTVAFRIVDQSGAGKDISGAVLNQRGDTVASFRSLKFGIGNFTFLPSISEQYKVILKGKQAIASIPFPVVQQAGYVLHVTDTLVNQLSVSIRSKGIEPTSEVYVLVHTRQIVKLAMVKSLNNGRAVFLLDKNNFEAGISHITVFNESHQPVSERLFFKHPSEELSITVQADEKKYSVRKKIQLGVQVTSTPFQLGNFSMAVFKADSLNQISVPDIQCYELLTSDLKGNVESPSFYFSTDPIAAKATDNLMLTHGWSRFKWDEILKNNISQPILFPPEYRNHVVTATIMNIKTATPASGIQTYLSTPGKNIRLYGARSDSKGDLHFDIRDFYEKRKIIIQPNLSQDSTFKIDIHTPYSETFSSYSLSPFSIKSSWKDQLIARSISMQTVNTYFGKDNTYKTFSIDSAAFYGEPDEKYLLDDYTRFSVMEEVMREYVHGVWVRKKDGKFIFKVPDEPHKSLFQNESLVLLDGVPIFDIDKIMVFSPLKVQKLDVMTRKYFLGSFTFEGIVSYTTYKGDLGGFELDPRATVLDYQGLQLQKEFFSPRYQTPLEVEGRLADRRNLLFWSPNINLSGNENQSIEFYSADEPGTYKVVIQGIGSNGITGSATTSFEVTVPENN